MPGDCARAWRRDRGRESPLGRMRVRGDAGAPSRRSKSSDRPAPIAVFLPSPPQFPLIWPVVGARNHTFKNGAILPPPICGRPACYHDPVLDLGGVRREHYSVRTVIDRALHVAPSVDVAAAASDMTVAHVREQRAPLFPTVAAGGEYYQAPGYDEVVTNGGLSAGMLTLDYTAWDWDGGRRACARPNTSTKRRAWGWRPRVHKLFSIRRGVLRSVARGGRAAGVAGQPRSPVALRHYHSGAGKAAA